MLRIALALAAAVAASSLALADERPNSLSIRAGDTALNIARVAIHGADNVLVIDQNAPPEAAEPNRIAVAITGDRNGGVAGDALAAPPLISDLGWGALSQNGEGNAMEIGVSGTGNLFAVAQSGSANTVLASIAGMQNQAAVSQVGANNVAAFSQVGNGNRVSITQTSW